MAHAFTSRTTRAPQLRKLYEGAQWRRWTLALKLGAHFNRPFRFLSDPFLRRRQVEQTAPDLHSSGIDGIMARLAVMRWKNTGPQALTQHFAELIEIH